MHNTIRNFKHIFSFFFNTASATTLLALFFVACSHKTGNVFDDMKIVRQKDSTPLAELSVEKVLLDTVKILEKERHGQLLRGKSAFWTNTTSRWIISPRKAVL